MNIDRILIHPNGDKSLEPFDIGVNIARDDNGKTHVNLFALQPEGDLTRDFSAVTQQFAKEYENIWSIANQVAEHYNLSETPDDIEYSFTSGYRSTAMHLTTVAGQPLKVDIADNWAFRLAGLPSNDARWTIEKYKTVYQGAQPVNMEKGREMERVPDPEPLTFFTLPCDHPAANDGVINCVPEMFNSPHMHDTHDFVLVDARKFFETLKQDHPYVLERLNTCRPQKWLEQRIPGRTVRETGCFVYSDGGYRDSKELHMCSGQAEFMEVLAKLDVPYMPVAITKGAEHDDINDFIAEFGLNHDRRDDFKPNPQEFHI